ncbi:PEP-CTERM sorting domain-containing protein [Marinobacter sediminum]|uniref:PEP-CTERM sorting domain-containing protein n=1 Tax=Marinobacter sediminum TaxID=256323 RepID=UPI0035643128
MKHTKRFRKTLPAVAGLLLACSGTASAGLMQVDFSGTITVADSGNNLGVAVNDTVTGWTTFDGLLLTGFGDETIGLGTDGNGYGGSLTMHIGTMTFTESDDIDYSGGDFFNPATFPELLFYDGALIGFDFIALNLPTIGDELSVYGTDFEFFSLNDTQVFGEWHTFSDPYPVIVPEPSTLSLLGVACLGLLARRRKAA